eukprot:9220526-Alexandrium_andersonii.AAC.1
MCMAALSAASRRTRRRPVGLSGSVALWPKPTPTMASSVRTLAVARRTCGRSGCELRVRTRGFG